MRIYNLKAIFKTAAQVTGLLLAGAVASFAQQQVNLTAGPSNAILPDGSSVPMWGYSCGTLVAGSTASCAALNRASVSTTVGVPSTWSPVVITVPSGQSLTINLTNHLSFTPATPAGSAPNNIPTSLTIVGQLGGGLGNSATMVPSPVHPGQIVTWATVGTSTAFTPPPQGSRVQSFGTEVAAVPSTTATSTALTWTTPRPGTYLIESGTHPSIQGPMGLYGILVVTCPPGAAAATCAAPGQAYPVGGTGTPIVYNSEVPLVFGEIDPNQNRAVTAAVNTAGFSETSTYQQNLIASPLLGVNVTNGGSGYTSAPSVVITGGGGVGATASATIDTNASSPTFGQVTAITVNLPGSGFTSNPSITLTGGAGTGATANAAINASLTNAMAQCQNAAACYPPAVNYTPLYYLINGVAFDKTHSATSLFPTVPGVAATPVAGTVLVRMVNAGLHMHVPSILGSLTTPPVSTTGGTSTTVGGFSLIAEDGNPLPGLPRVQTDVFMAAGKTYDVMINVPAAGSAALPVYDRELSLSGNSVNRDSGMLAYIGVNGSGLPTAGSLGAAVARADTYNSLIAGQTFTVSDPSKGVIANDTNVFGVQLDASAAVTGGTVTLNPNGTFTFVATASTGGFGYCANGTTQASLAPICTKVTLNGATVEAAGGMTVPNRRYVANTGSSFALKTPGVLGTAFDTLANPAAAKDAAGYPLTVATATVTPASSLLTVVPDANGGFAASIGTACTTAAGCPYTFTFQAQNSQGTLSAAATVTVVFQAKSNLQVTVLDGYDKKTVITDYRWVIEEDRSFYIDPTKTQNNGGTTVVPTLGVNFHTSYMPYVAQGCTGPLSCEGGQFVFDNGTPCASLSPNLPAGCSPTAGQHIAAVCDVGNGVCRPDSTGNGFTQVMPSSVHLDPTRRYYISVLPGDSAGPFTSAYGGAPTNCSSTPGTATPGTSQTCGHGMGGAPITFGATAVTVLTQPTPNPTAKLSVFVFEDDFPLNGEHDSGGGNGVSVATNNEPGLGGFQLHLWDAFGGNGDFTGQMTYDMFNQPLTNGLAGQIDPSDGLDACPMSNTFLSSRTNPSDPTQTGITGMIITCPLYESDGKTPSPLAGQAVIENLMPGRWGVIASPGADRIARGEEWLQTNTLDGQKAHDSFTRIGEPGYFQEFGPASFHVSIGFANPAIINKRHEGVCAGTDPHLPTGTYTCNNTITGRVVGERLSRTPDERLYGSGSHDAYYWTQCYVSFGDQDGEDFAFTKCAADGTFTLSNLPQGDWRVTTFDQWNDQLVDGLSTPVRLGTAGSLCPGTGSTTNACNMGDIATTQWQTNLYTKTFINDDKSGVCSGSCSPSSPGIPFANVAVRLRDGSIENLLVSDFTGTANFNETFPLFAWYTVETDVTRYKNTGTHVVYDAGGPADGTLSTCGGTVSGTGFPPCGTSTIGKFLANTVEEVSLPTNLRYPGAVYCATADCTGKSIQNGPASSDAPSSCTTSNTGATTCSGTPLSTGRIDPPWVGIEGWQGFPGQNNFMEFGKAPYFEGENGGIHGHVIYASTRPFDDPMMLVQTQWEPLVPNVTINLYQEGFAGDGITPTLTLVDHTQTSSFDDFAQGFRSDGVTPNMNCPGQGNGTAGTAIPDLFFFSLENQPDYLDVYNNAHNGTPLHTVPNSSQFKCYDGMHNWNQIQPVPYDGAYQFPSVTSYNLTTGVPNGTNCTICIGDPVPSTGTDADPLRSGLPMLPAGKYVVEVVLPPGFELVKEEDKNILIGDNFIAPVTQQFGGLGNIFIIPDQASVASSQLYPGPGYNANNAQNPTQSFGTTPSNNIVPGFIPEPTWPCVGESRVVPDYISLYPQTHQVAPFAGATRNLCDRKEVTLTDQVGAIAKFYMYTSTHIAAKFTGGITDDYTSEFDPFSPQFGEKFAPPNLPISIKDWAGNETSRVYADHWGSYDGMTYSTWEVNPPNPTGYAPTMMVFCMNDPGPIPNPANPSQMITDPLFTQGYSQFCYELPFMPGTTQYLDTPVVPTSAFAGAGYNNVDCAYPTLTPAISEVDGDGIGPWVARSNTENSHHTLRITALGMQTVPNYAYSGPSATLAPFNQKSITRDYGFGTTKGHVTIGGVSVSQGNITWGPATITVNVPNGVPPCTVQQQPQYATRPGAASFGVASCGELVITRGDNGRQSVDAVTVTIGGRAPTHVPASGSIQSAIDAAAPGDLIIIDPTCTTTATGAALAVCPAPGAAGVTFSAAAHTEMVLMWKPVRLQGVGAASSIINANTHPAGRLDAWRRTVNCLFGLSLSGTPLSSAPVAPDPNANVFDPTNVASCPGTGWQFFSQFDESNPAKFNPQIDRLPLEATIGWTAELNGNLAELLQEPALMGALEGATITVLGKGVDFHAQDPYAASLLAGFPTGTTLLQGATAECSKTTIGRNGRPVVTEIVPNPFPSNYSCNPSSIDGLGLTDSSQGGGAIFVHGWGSNLQIANNRIQNNAGTLSGGINVGQGEYPPAYIQGGTTNAAPGSCLDDPTLPAGTVLPYCQNVNVNIHNNYISLNSSTGDELFSATPAGAGGVSICTGSDYYQFNYNWVCGNLSSGDGGGLGHLGFSYNGDIEHNTIIFNQSLNPTIPANGGGIVVMGTPDADILCNIPNDPNANIDQDCVAGQPGNTPLNGVGPSDGAGPNLLINANLIMGNAAEAGTGGGIAFQQVNGSDVIAFPTSPEEWNTVTFTNNIVTNNVAGWDGAGISLEDSLAIDVINNTIANNVSTATAGVLFNTLGAPLASQQGGSSTACSPSCGNTSNPQVAGVVALQHSPVLQANLAATTVCPTGHPHCTSVSFPKLENDILWHNSTYYIGVATTPSAQYQQNVVTLFNSFAGTAQSSQTATGQCFAASYWDLGIRGDLNPNDNSGSGGAFTLAPSDSVLTPISGTNPYSGNGNFFNIANGGLMTQYCDGSRQPPEFQQSGFAVPPGISDATVPNPFFNLTPVATVDEGNNWINLRWGPLSLVNPVTNVTLANYGISAPNNLVQCPNQQYFDAPAFDFFGSPRKPTGNCTSNNALDAGAVEALTAGTPGSVNAEVLSLDPPTAPNGSGNINVNLSGSGLTGAQSVRFLGSANTPALPNITVNSSTVVNDSSINANIALPLATFTGPNGLGGGGRNPKNGTITLHYAATAPGTYGVVVVAPRGNSLPIDFTVTNGGPFTLGAATITRDSGTGTFTITGGTCVSGFVLSAAAGHTSCTVTVHYVPPVAPAAVASTAHVTVSFPHTALSTPVFNAN